MTKPIVWSLLAKQDFENSLDYLSKYWNLSVVLNFMNLTEEKINFICLHPKQFPFVNKSKKVRKCVLTKHSSIIYLETKHEIQLLRIFDTRQNPKKLKI